MSFRLILKSMQRNSSNIRLVLQPERTIYALDPSNDELSKADFAEARTKDYSCDLSAADVPVKTGRLAATLEGAGKRRVFAIGNYIKQRLLAPYHRWFMTRLRRIPMDGTFDQCRPLDYLVGSNVTYCFDLKSATDRWPLPLLNTMAQLLLGNLRGKTLVEVCLGSNKFYVGPPLTKREFEPLCFKAGQPLGYLASWPLFSLCHHF